MIAPGDLVNAQATAKAAGFFGDSGNHDSDKLRRVMLRELIQAQVGIVISCRGAAVNVMFVYDGKMRFASVSKRYICMLKGGGMSQREHDVRAAFTAV